MCPSVEIPLEVAMINDCAHVGETLLKYLNVKGTHIKRTRGLWSKTFGIAYGIWRTKADVYHVHYLLQDCFMASVLGKRPLIGHAHGSDLRTTIDHPLWGWIVKYNLRRCDKVIVSTPDILGIARRFRGDAEYVPNPVDTELFHPKPPREHRRKKVLIASDSNWEVKGTDVAIRALSRIKDKVDVSIIAYGRDFERTVNLAMSLGMTPRILPKVPHWRMNQYYWDSDVVIDRFRLGSLGMVSLEAIACGRPVVTYVSSEYPEYKDFPLKDLCDEEGIAEAVLEASTELWEAEYRYVMRNHDPRAVANTIMEIYRSLLQRWPSC